MRIKINKLSYGGAGIGTVNGKIVFVKRGLPGDTVEADVIKEKKNYCLAEAEKVITPSEYRVEPQCPVFGACGGCQWQDLDYEIQLEEKRNIVSESIERIGKIHSPEVLPVVASPAKYGYRSKIVLSVVREGKTHSVSFYEEGTDRKVPIDRCPVANEQVNKGIETVNGFLANNISRARSLEKIYIASGDNTTGITVSQRVNRKAVKRNLDTEHMKLTGKDEAEIEIGVNGKKFVSVPSLFIQANTGVSGLMTETLLDWTRQTRASKILDLFCGFGNFTIPVSDIAKHVTGVDSNNLAIKYAHKNSSLNGSANAEFVTGDADSFLRKATGHFDTVILDPPREGASECSELLGKMKPGTIIYISCDPSTLARDLKKLCSFGYMIKSIKPFDMFPHTFHIECMVLLESM